MYYSATSATSTSQHCNGAATSLSPLGPFEPLANTLGDCQLSLGGSIDPAGTLSFFPSHLQISLSHHPVLYELPDLISQSLADIPRDRLSRC